MSKRLLALVLIIVSVIAYHLLASDFETTSIWQTEIENKILSDPLAAAGNYVFWGGNKGKNLYKLYLINSQGQKVAESQDLPHLPFDPIVIGNNVIMADHGRMLRGFSLPDFKVAWEVASNDMFEFPPIKCGNSNVLQSSGKSIFCFDSKTGKQLWDITVNDGMKNYACDKVIVAIHGYKDVSKPNWKCSAYDLEYGVDLWTLEEPVSKETPLFVKDTCVVTTAEGEAIVVNQLSGQILYRSGAKGYIAVKALDEGVILANQAYTNFVYLSLLTGKSWTSTLKKDFVGAVQIGSNLVIADKVTLRCFDINSGVLTWQKDLGDIYGCFPHRNGIFVTYKEDFSARQTFAACLGADSSNNLWLAKGSSLFRKPYPLAEGDLLLNYDGTIRLMPKPVFKNNSTSVSMPSMPDPTQKVNQAFEKITPQKASNTQQIQNNKNTNQAIPPVVPTVSDEDAGW